jgi:hypothetical protein
VEIVLFEIEGKRKLTVVTLMEMVVQLLAGMETLCYRKKRQNYFDMCVVMPSLLEIQAIMNILTCSHS